jgi:thiol:disulfide interchange protein
MIKKILFSLVALFGLVALDVRAFEGEVIKTDISEARIVFDKVEADASKAVWLSLYIELEEGWHIYANPSGEAGYPTEIAVDAPENIAISDIYWQDAIAFDSDGFLSYGYKGAAHHLVKLDITNDSANDTIPLNIKAKWLACNKICIPEQGEWQIELPAKLELLQTEHDLSKIISSVNLGKARIVNANILPSENEQSSIIVAIALAFIGGLILNLMPCVLPILALKSLSLVKIAGRSRRTSCLYGISYTCGIMFGFAGFAVAINLLQMSGEAIGWGFQMQSPIFVAMMALLMLLIGLNLSGFFEVPHLNINGFRAQNAVIENFMTGLLAVAVATPCTAPFMAGALGYAITQSFAVQLLIFLSLGLGLAFPYLLISLLPKLASLMPKSGAWMLTFKQFLAFPMYAAAAWLAWVLSINAGTDALAALFLGAIISALLIWSIQKMSGKIWRLILVILFAGNIYLMVQNIQYLKSDNGLSEIAQPYSAEKLEELRSAKQPTFVYATADWCITCKINERLVLRDQAVTEYFKQNNINVLKADFTNHDENIAQLLKQNGLAGVPAYIYYDSSGEALVLNNFLKKSDIFKLQN